MTDTPKKSTATTTRRPDCVTTAADKMMKVLEAESATGHKLIYSA